MRDPQPTGVKPRDLTADQPESVGRLELVGALEQHLHAQADAEHGNAFGGAGTDKLGEPERVQAPHRLRKRSDSGHDQAVAVAQYVGIAGHRHLCADVLERLCTDRRMPIP